MSATDSLRQERPGGFSTHAPYRAARCLPPAICTLAFSCPSDKPGALLLQSQSFPGDFHQGLQPLPAPVHPLSLFGESLQRLLVGFLFQQDDLRLEVFSSRPGRLLAARDRFDLPLQSGRAPGQSRQFASGLLPFLPTAGQAAQLSVPYLPPAGKGGIRGMPGQPGGASFLLRIQNRVPGKQPVENGLLLRRLTGRGNELPFSRFQRFIRLRQPDIDSARLLQKRCLPLHLGRGLPLLFDSLRQSDFLPVAFGL